LNFDRDFLSELESVKNSDFERSHSSYVKLDTKAITVSSAYVAYIASTLGYFVKNNSQFETPQTVFFLGLLPSLFVVFMFVYNAIKSRKYQEGMQVPMPLQNNTLEEYYKKRIKFLDEAFDQNTENNTLKSRAINGIIVMTAASLLISSILYGSTLFLDIFWPEIPSACILTGAFFIAVILTIIVAHNFAPSLRESKIEA